MDRQYRTRVCERRFLNKPSFHAGAYVLAEVEHTGGRGLKFSGDSGYANFEPYMTLEIADCSERIKLEFDIETPASRRNTLHKIDVLIRALERLRAGIEVECELYVARERELRRHRKRANQKADGADGPAPSAPHRATGTRRRIRLSSAGR